MNPSGSATDQIEPGDWIDDDVEDGCLHGVPWCDDCLECEDEDEQMWRECGFY